MNKEINIYEIMLELSEEENSDLKEENEALWNYINYLNRRNAELVLEYDNLTSIKKRLN